MRTKYKFTKGTRVDYQCAFSDGVSDNSTPGTITSRTRLDDDEPAYRVKWDDGFQEQSDQQDANLWPQGCLVALQEGS